MILESLVLMFFGLVKILLSLIPDLALSLPQEILGGIAGFVELIGGVTFVFPVSVFVACCGWLVVLYGFEFVVSVINWIIRKIPGLS
jgi:hypothetical protein